MMRSACLTRVPLTRVAVDASVVIASSSRFLHSAVCPCPDIGKPCAVNIAGWASHRVTKLFKGCLADVDIACSFVVAGGLWLESVQHQAVVGQSTNLSKHRPGSAPKTFHGHSTAICGRIAALARLTD